MIVESLYISFSSVVLTSQTLLHIDDSFGTNSFRFFYKITLSLNRHKAKKTAASLPQEALATL